MSDIFSALNEHNRELQGKGSNILLQSDKIRAFVGKLELWKNRAERKGFPSFCALSECMADMENDLPDAVAEDIKQHLDGWWKNSSDIFPGSTMRPTKTSSPETHFAGRLTTYQKHARKSSLI